MSLNKKLDNIFYDRSIVKAHSDSMPTPVLAKNKSSKPPPLPGRLLKITDKFNFENLETPFGVHCMTMESVKSQHQGDWQQKS